MTSQSELSWETTEDGKNINFSNGTIWPHPDGVLQTAHRCRYGDLTDDTLIQVERSTLLYLASICNAYCHLIGTNQSDRNKKASAIKKVWQGRARYGKLYTQ